MPDFPSATNANREQMHIRFWGVRGSIPTPKATHLGTGGNTACVEVRLSDGSACILDLGTGALELGRKLVEDAAGDPLDLHVFLSHFHWDHIQAVPFFAPLFEEGNRVTFYGSDTEGEPLDLLTEQMRVPFFPLSFSELAAETSQIILREGVPVTVGGLTVTPFPVHHTQFVFGYKLEAGGVSAVFCTDYEHGNERLDLLLAEVASGADLLICDAQYTPEEYAHCIGWGHTTWERAAQLAAESKVKRLALFHHDPAHTDQQLSEILRAAQKIFPNTMLATEGATIVC